MTRVLLRLKFALLRNSMRDHGGGVVVAYGVALLCGLAVGGLLLWSRAGGAGVAKAVALAVPTVLFLGWITAPVLTTGFDSTVDPARLAVYPLSPTQMTIGLFAVASVGGGGLFSAMTMAGTLGAIAPAGPLAVLCLAAAVCVVAVCVAASRAMAALISAASRRVRDTLLFVVPLIFMSLGVLPQVFRVEENDSLASLGRLADGAETFATFLPSGAAAHSLLAASQGRGVDALLWLVGALAWIAVMLWAWSRALRRSLVRAVAAPAVGARDHRIPASTSLYQRPVRWLPRNRVGAVAAKELRLAIRDPRQRVALMGTVIGAVPFALVGMTTPGQSSLFRVSAVSFFAAANATNFYGFDGASLWMNISAGDDARSDLAGKCLGRALLIAPVVLVLVAVMASMLDAWSRALPALTLAFAGLGLGLGPASWVSVRHPWAMPPTQKNVFSGANTGQGFQAVGPMLLITFLGSIVLFGIGVPMAMTSSAMVVTLLSVLALAVGVLAFVIGFSRAEARSRDRQPELLLALTKP